MRLGLLDYLFGGNHAERSPELLDAVEWAVGRVEPLLKQVGGYPGRYLKPVAQALEYAQALAAKVPGPVSITPASYAADPLVHALFPLPENLHAAFEVSKAMAEFVIEHPDTTEVYAMVCMRRKVKNLLGMEITGDMLRRDVQQEAVFFTDYTLAEPGTTEAESRARVARGFFESLCGHVVNRIQMRKLARAREELARDELLADLRLAGPERRDELQKRLDTVLNQLSESVHGLELDRYHRDFEAVLLEPDKYLYLENTEMSLDSMGIVRQADADGSDDLVFCDLIGRDRRRWTVTMMYCNHVEAGLSTADRFKNAQRRLGF